MHCNRSKLRPGCHWKMYSNIIALEVKIRSVSEDVTDFSKREF